MTPGAAGTNQLSAACFLFHSPLSYFIAFETFFFFYSVELCPWWQCSKRTPPNSFLFSFILSFFAHALKASPVLTLSVPHLHFSHFQPFLLILPMLNCSYGNRFTSPALQPWAEVGSDPEPSSFLPLCDGTCLLALLRTFWNTSYYHNFISFLFFFLHSIHGGPAGNLTFKIKYCLISSSWADFHCPDWFRGMNKPPQLLRLHICNYLSINESD